MHLFLTQPNQLLGPEDMVNPNADELSMMTYLSQYPDAKLKPGAPINKKKLKKGDPNKVKVFGPGVEEHGLDTNVPAAEFTVDTRGAGDGNITAVVNGPDGPIECAIQLQRNGTNKCSYVPNIEGDYVVNVNFNGYPVGKSPFNVKVTPGVDSSACVAYGPGLEATDLRAGSPTEFWVETTGAGDGQLNVVVKGPKGSIASKELKIDQETNDKYHIEYMSEEVGPHTIEVTYSGLHIPDSPFKVRIGSDRPNAKKCKADGPGIQETGVEINKNTWFDVHKKGAGRGDLSVHIKGPHGTEEMKQENIERDLDHFTYTPTQSGEYVITIKYGGDNIPGSRFRVQVEPPTDPSKCVAFGPGLSPQGVRINDPAKFTVRTKDAGHGDIDVKITGPNGEIPYQVETLPYTYNYTYQAEEPGDYVVDIQFAGVHIPSSPFPVAITDANKVKISGPGMDGECLPVSVPLLYHVDARNAGPGEIQCTVQNRESLKQDEEQTDSVDGPVITANGDGTFKIEYTPVEPGLQRMNVTFGETTVPKTPLRLSIFDPNEVKVYGPGLEDGNKSGKKTDFTIDMRTAGEGHLDVSVEGPQSTPITVKDQANNVVKCEYIPETPGDYVINVKYSDVHVPNSPFNVSVQPFTDPNAVKAYGPGLESGLKTDSWAEFFVDYTKAGHGEPQVTVNGPGGGENVEEEQVDNGIRKYRYYIDPDEAGDYKIDITYADNAIPNSPFNVHVDWKTDPTRVKAYGPGVEGGNIGEWTEFTVDMTKAGDGGLDLQIEGPCEAEVIVDDHENGTASVKYLPKEPGEYKINIFFADEAIPESPFTPLFVPETDPKKVRAYGPGLKHDGVKVGDPGDFVVDTRAAGAGAVDVVVDGPYWRGCAPTPPTGTPSPGPGSRPGSTSGVRRRSMSTSAKSKITSNNDDTYDVIYNPRKVGTYKIDVFFADQSIPECPCEVNVTDPSSVVVKGPGLDENGDSFEEIPVLSIADKKPLVWTIDCTEAGPGAVDAKLYGSDGKEKDIQLVEGDEDEYNLSYTPDSAGRHRLVLKYSGNEIQQSPLDFSLADSSQVKVTGPGLAGGRVTEEMVIDVDSTKAGDGGLALSLSGPSHAQLNCDDHQDGTATLRFIPTEAGMYKLDIKFSDEDVPGSTFAIPIIDPTKCTATGSGVTGVGARTGLPAQVFVDTRNSGPAPVVASVIDPSGKVSNIEFTPGDEEGVFVGEYTPEEIGLHKLDVEFAQEPISNSPFNVPICNPDAVELSGPGLESAIKNLPNVIDVFTPHAAGPASVDVQMQSLNESAPPVQVSLKKIDDEHFQIEYIPQDLSDVELEVFYGGFPVTEKKTIPVCDSSKVGVEGSGVEPGNIAKKETEFIVDATAAGFGELAIDLTNGEGKQIDVAVTELEPRKWQVKYTPEEAGTHQVDVKYGKQAVQGSPFVVNVCDPLAVNAYGPGLEKAITSTEAKFIVDTVNAGEGNLGLNILGPSDCVIKCDEQEPGIYEVTYIADRAGVYSVELTFANHDVPNSPFEVKCCRPPPDASKCIVRGLENPGSFMVDCSDAGGSGLLEVGVAGAYVPVEFVSVKHNGDYTFSISYDISEPGETLISVKWHGQHLTGSPFTVITE